MKFKSYVIFALIFGVAPNFYFWLFGGWGLAVNICALIPTVALLSLIPFIGAGIRYTEVVTAFSYIIFSIELPKFILAMFSDILRHALPTPVADGIALGIAIAVMLFFLTLIFFVSRHLTVQELEIGFEDLPEDFDGLRICQLSDFHLGSYGTICPYVKRIIDTALSLSPEIILFTGDLVNFSTSEAVPYAKELGRLTAPMGIYAIRGNHDYLLHGHHDEASRLKDTEDLMNLEKGFGWKLLLNENTFLERKPGGDKIALCGVENISTNPFYEQTGGDLEKTLSGLPDGIFKILMSHNPSHWRQDVANRGDVQLTLSGHTHGLSIKLEGLRPSHWRFPFPKGVFREGNSVIHVSRGLGSAFAFRLGGFPSVDIITLRRQGA